MPDEDNHSAPVTIAELVAQLNRAQTESEDARVLLDALRTQYEELEGICGTQADELIRLRKIETTHAKLLAEHAKLTERLGRLQSLVTAQRSVTGTLRLALWQVHRLPGLLLGRK